MNIDPSPQKWCPGCQRYHSIEDYPMEKGERKVLCGECVQNGPQYVNGTLETRLECTLCKELKPLSQFALASPALLKRNAPSIAARFGHRGQCKKCTRPSARAARRAPLVGSGLRISAGNGLIHQAPKTGVTVSVPTPAIVAEQERSAEELAGTSLYEDVTIGEWLSLDTRSVFVFGRYALILERREGGNHIDILSVSGEGPGVPVEAGIASYIVKILLGKDVDTIRGAMYY